jgi:hypothetical protein
MESELSLACTSICGDMGIVARGIADVPLVVCHPLVWRTHPELFHYTAGAGFEGIVRSNSFWATHFHDLKDDPTEIIGLRTSLPPAIAARYDEIVATFKTNRIGRRLWKKSGRGLGTARDFVNGLYGATFDRKAPTALDAFVTSFSTHAGDGSFEREHGLWSQWRDYAGLDGYCIVLDTKAMGLLLAEECDVRYWAHLKLEPVRYGDRPVAELFPELVEAAGRTLQDFVAGVREPEMGVQEFLIGSTLLKDPKYRPEREVRIVAIPGTANLSEIALRENADVFKPLPLPKVRARNDGRRYVSVFEGKPVRLPILRFIVGPAAGADERIALARSLLPGVPISTSRCAP